jgi:hypothetical protein
MRSLDLAWTRTSAPEPLDAETGAEIQGHLDRAEAFEGGQQARAAKALLDAAAASLKDVPGQELLIEDIQELRATLG